MARRRGRRDDESRPPAVEAPPEVSDGIPYGVRLAAAWSWRLLLMGGVLAVIIFLIIQLRLIIIPILVAVLIGALLVPFSAFLQRHAWPKWLAVTVAMLSALAVVGGLLTLGITQIVRGADDLAAQSLVAWDDFRVWLLEGPMHITEQQLNDFVDQVITSVQQDSGLLVSGALSFGSTLGHFLAGMLLAIFATLFMLIDGRGIWNWVVGIFPRRARVAVDGAGNAGWATLQNFVKVQILVATIDAVGIGLGAFFLGVPLAVPDRDPGLPRLVHPDRRRRRHRRARGVRRARLQRSRHRHHHARDRAPRAAGRGSHPATAHHGNGGQGASARRRRRRRDRVAPRRHPRCALRGAGRRGAQRHDRLRVGRLVEGPRRAAALRAALADLAHRAATTGLPTRRMNDLSTTIAGPSLAEFIDARAVVARVARQTPMESSRFLARTLGVPVYLKCENLQRTGSYKLRGAYNRLSSLTEEERARGVVAASAGNHAQGVAFAARELGITATIFMPVGVALPKLAATRAYGAEVVLRGDSVGETLEAAAVFAAETGAVIIPPFDHHDVIAGQGTLGLEILEQAPDATTVSCRSAAAGSRRASPAPSSSVLPSSAAPSASSACRPRTPPPYVASLAAGAPMNVPVVPTIADGIAVYRPGELNFEIIREAVDEVVTVSEDDIARALLVLLERAKLVVEPAGAVSVAALMTGPCTATVRSSRCSRAATSTRCSCSASSRTASPPRAAT